MNTKEFRRKFMAYFLSYFSKCLYDKYIYIDKKDYDRLINVFNSILDKNVKKIMRGEEKQ